MFKFEFFSADKDVAAILHGLAGRAHPLPGQQLCVPVLNAEIAEEPATRKLPKPRKGGSGAKPRKVKTRGKGRKGPRSAKIVPQSAGDRVSLLADYVRTNGLEAVSAPEMKAFVKSIGLPEKTYSTVLNAAQGVGLLKRISDDSEWRPRYKVVSANGAHA